MVQITLSESLIPGAMMWGGCCPITEAQGHSAVHPDTVPSYQQSRDWSPSGSVLEPSTFLQLSARRGVSGKAAGTVLGHLAALRPAPHYSVFPYGSIMTGGATTNSGLETVLGSSPP